MRRVIPLCALLAIWAAAGFVRADDNGKLVPSITVVGVGEVQVQPDMASVTVGVTTEAVTAGAALKENNERMSQLLDTLRGLNVPDKHVQTLSFSVSPKQSYDRDRDRRNPPKIVGYTVANQVRVKVLELDRLGSLLDAVVQAGGNRIQGVTFSLAEPKTHMDQARRKAIADARQRAELYAGEAGVNAGSALLIQERSAAMPRPMAAAGLEMRGEAASAVPISRGEQTISAHVTVTYAIVE